MTKKENCGPTPLMGIDPKIPNRVSANRTQRSVEKLTHCDQGYTGSPGGNPHPHGRPPCDRGSKSIQSPPKVVRGDWTDYERNTDQTIFLHHVRINSQPMEDSKARPSAPSVLCFLLSRPRGLPPHPPTRWGCLLPARPALQTLPAPKLWLSRGPIGPQAPAASPVSALAIQPIIEGTPGS